MSNSHARQVADERAVDERYQQALRRDDDRTRQMSTQGPANGRWTRTAQPRGQWLPSGPLVGRVALHHTSEIVGGLEFYIGPRHVEEDGLTVFSWAAPIANTFFRGHNDHPLSADVALTRTFVRRGDRIVDYEDEIVSGPVLDQPFAQRALSIPKAPSQRSIPGKVPAKPVKATRQDDRAESADRTTPARNLEPTQSGDGTAVNLGMRLGRSALRAGRAVHDAITAPRRERLGSVLATLQPEQYDLVTRDPSTPLIIHGPPGTGKTIVAAHRAAYLVDNQANAKRAPRRVLVVGPTEHYVKHIEGVLTELTTRDSGVRSLALCHLMAELRDLPGRLDGSLPCDFRDVDEDLGELAEQAAHLLRADHQITPTMKHERAVTAVYEALRANRVGTRTLTKDVEWADYLRGLPSMVEARRMSRFLPLLARCAHSARPASARKYDHIIVDEAQDVTPLEWRLLADLNGGGGWTLLGDMNQRRSDWAHHTWDSIGATLELAEPGSTIHVEQIDRGYRTTSSIMRLAARLLPRTARTAESLQGEGVEPRIERVTASELHASAVREALHLVENHHDGTVAIITVDPRKSVQVLRRRGFTNDPLDSRRLVRDDQTVRVLDAQDARGLEFDAVVVVEPGAFPPNLGRHPGLLYTSLTRANRALVIVHSARLPDALRSRRRSA